MSSIRSHGKQRRPFPILLRCHEVGSAQEASINCGSLTQMSYVLIQMPNVIQNSDAELTG
jgi:hypothetical protein